MSDPKQAEQYTPHRKLSVVYFHGSVMFGSEMNSAAVSSTGGNSVDSILPGVIQHDGTARVATAEDKHTDGLLMRKKRHELHTNKRVLAQTLVPWANIKSVGYGE